MLFKTLRKERKLSQGEVANALGLRSYQAVQKWEKGENAIPESYYESIATLFGVSVSVFQSNTSQHTKEYPGYITSEPSTGYRSNARSVTPNISELYQELPFASIRAQAGIPNSNESCQLTWITETYPVILRNYIKGKKQLVIEIDGDSMTPGIVDGAHVLGQLVAQDDVKYESGGVYAVMFAGGRFVIKRIKTNTINTEGVLRLWSDNETYGYIDIKAEDIQCMWKITGKVWEPMK